MKKQSLTAIVMAAVFALALSASAGSKAIACINCNESESGREGCICFCEHYADDTANNDQYGNNSWGDQFISCYVAQNGCEYEQMATRESREQSLEAPKFKREPKPQPIRRQP